MCYKPPSQLRWHPDLDQPRRLSLGVDGIQRCCQLRWGAAHQSGLQHAPEDTVRAALGSVMTAVVTLCNEFPEAFSPERVNWVSGILPAVGPSVPPEANH